VRGADVTSTVFCNLSPDWESPETGIAAHIVSATSIILAK
jgi:hypothetical protein